MTKLAIDKVVRAYMKATDGQFSDDGHRQPYGNYYESLIKDQKIALIPSFER